MEMNLDLFSLAQSSPIHSDPMREGISIAVVGIVIVFSALILITLFIASLPRVLKLVHLVWPEVSDGNPVAGHPESQVADDADVLAAIGFVLHTEFQKQLTTESSTAER